MKLQVVECTQTYLDLFSSSSDERIGRHLPMRLELEAVCEANSCVVSYANETGEIENVFAHWFNVDVIRLEKNHNSDYNCSEINHFRSVKLVKTVDEDIVSFSGRVSYGLNADDFDRLLAAAQSVGCSLSIDITTEWDDDANSPAGRYIYGDGGQGQFGDIDHTAWDFEVRDWANIQDIEISATTNYTNLHKICRLHHPKNINVTLS